MKTPTISIVALCLFGMFVAPVMAAKPDQSIFISAGPVRPPWTCDVYNNTDHEIIMHLDICIGTADHSNDLLCKGALLILEPDRIFGRVFTDNPPESAICNVYYDGKSGDITGTFCGSNGCLQLQPR